MNKTLQTLMAVLFLALPIVVLAGWVQSILYVRDHTQHYTIVMTGYDPRDVLQGEYLYMTYDWNNPHSDKTGMAAGDLPATTKYFVPEGDSADLTTLLREGIHVFTADVGIMNKKVQVMKLMIDGKPWQEALDAWRQNRQNFVQPTTEDSSPKEK